MFEIRNREFTRIHAGGPSIRRVGGSLEPEQTGAGWVH